MLQILKTRINQRYRTMRYPAGPEPVLPARFAGKPVLSGAKCSEGCSRCAEACPAKAIGIQGTGVVSIDMGRCIFCGDCARNCSSGAISFSGEHRLAALNREELVVTSGQNNVPPSVLSPVHAKLFGRSLKLRQVCAGGCNACEADTNVLCTIGWDIGRFGIQFVASPRHADGIFVTGPVTVNMREALLKTFDAVPSPKIVIAAGSCAISGGLYEETPETGNGVDSILPVDIYIPGCPPHPLTILDGLLRFLGRN
jgi:Ni,Fe-hydrogenase III small subunit/Pyruvate/2-oxoacid:ferredoxin oxidoreductase delta subunit